jgi:hypothetical protein
MANCVLSATEPMEADALPRAGRPAAPEVHVVTAEEAAAGAYDIERVVLPLPGASVRYPEHATEQARPHMTTRQGRVRSLPYVASVLCMGPHGSGVGKQHLK